MVIGENKKAVIWSGIDKIANYIVNLSIQIILARLLMPDDYTVVAMLAIFFAISQAFIDSGFATSLIQRKNCTQRDYSSVFFFNILISVVFYTLLYCCAPLIEKFYKFPNLALVTRIYSISLVISSLGMINRVILTKELQFKKIAIVSLTATSLSAVPAIILASYGFGYWSLVLQNIASALISVILLFWYSKWVPSAVFSWNSLKELAPFGLRILIVSIFHAIYNNIYSLLIGKRFVPQDLGLYDRGKTLASSAPIGFSDFFTRALYPIQSKRQSDSSFLEYSYNKAFSLAAIIICPISIFLSVFSYSSILTLYGGQWTECTRILAILSIGYMFYPLQSINMNMLKVGGRADYLLHSEIIKKSTGILIVLVAINYSLTTVVLGWTICAIIEFIISEVYYKKLFNYSLKQSLAVLLSQTIISIFLSAILFLVFNYLTDNNFIIFFGGGIIFVSIYLVISVLIYPSILWGQKKHRRLL